MRASPALLLTAAAVLAVSSFVLLIRHLEADDADIAALRHYRGALEPPLPLLQPAQLPVSPQGTVTDPSGAAHAQAAAHAPREQGDVQRPTVTRERQQQRASRQAKPPPAEEHVATTAGAAARHAQCSASRVRAVSHQADIPLLLSASVARRRPRFDVEHPVSLEKFNKSLLPLSSHLSQNGFGARRESCAVVGCSGALLARRDGALIDSHQHVLRINAVRTAGFQACFCFL